MRSAPQLSGLFAAAGMVAVVGAVLWFPYRRASEAVWLLDTSGGSTAVTLWGVAFGLGLASSLVAAVVVTVFDVAPRLWTSLSLGMGVAVWVPVVLAEDQATVVPVVALAAAIFAAVAASRGTPFVVVAGLLVGHGALVVLSARWATCSGAEDCYRSQSWSTTLGLGFWWLGVSRFAVSPSAATGD